MPEPSLLITYIEAEQPDWERYAICLPFGDQAGLILFTPEGPICITSSSAGFHV